MKLFNTAKKYGSKVLVPVSGVVLALATSLASAQAVAAGDYGAATAIASTQVVVLAIIAGFITMGIAVWGASYILRRFFPKGR